MNEQIIQKYVNLLSQKIYDCFFLETELEKASKIMEENNKEIGRLKKILDENEIIYEKKEAGDEPKQGQKGIFDM